VCVKSSENKSIKRSKVVNKSLRAIDIYWYPRDTSSEKKVKMTLFWRHKNKSKKWWFLVTKFNYLLTLKIEIKSFWFFFDFYVLDKMNIDKIVIYTICNYIQKRQHFMAKFWSPLSLWSDENRFALSTLNPCILHGVHEQKFVDMISTWINIVTLLLNRNKFPSKF